MLPCGYRRVTEEGSTIHTCHFIDGISISCFSETLNDTNIMRRNVRRNTNEPEIVIFVTSR